MKRAVFSAKGEEKLERIGIFCDKMREKGFRFLSDFRIVNSELFIIIDIWRD